MNIIILDDYQDAVRKLPCAAKLSDLNAKVFTNTVKGIGQLSIRLRDAEVLVLIRERTRFPRQLLEKLPKLRLIAQTGRVGEHIDVDACTHQGCSLADGTVDERAVTVECPCHGSVFDIETGEPVEGPAEDPVPIFEARIVDGWVEVTSSPRDA